MGSEIQIAEQRLKSFTSQLQTECGILERLVYKHKNQHRRCSYFQYILKVRRDLKLLKSANLEEVLESAFVVINGDRPKQKVQLLEGIVIGLDNFLVDKCIQDLPQRYELGLVYDLKRRKCSSGKYNFLERLLGVTRLLSQMVEPLLKAAIEISTLLAQSFFMKFSLAVLSVLARIRVLVQQMLLDVVLLYNTVSSLSQREQSIKLNQEGFEVFREYYPRKEEARKILECIWLKDKFVLVEMTHKSETSSREEVVDGGDSLPSASQILYDNIEVLLGVGDSGAISSEDPAANTVNVEENCSDSILKKDEMNIPGVSDLAQSSSENVEDVFTNSAAGIISETNSDKLVGEESCLMMTSEGKGTHLEAGKPASSSVSTLSFPIAKGTKRKVAFVAVKKPATSTPSRSKSGPEMDEKKDPFFSLLTGGNKSSVL